MIRNIPNKYSLNDLLNEINKTHLGAYDFLYLPIDFVNKANIGYGFINLVHPLYVISFFKEFNRRKWPLFNSPKIGEISYGRL